MLAAFGTKDPVGVLPLDGEGRGFEPGLLPRARLDHLGLEAAIVGPALVHAEEHLGEVLGVGAADVGLERDDRVALVVLPAEERLFLEASELLAERRDGVGDLLLHPAVHREELLCVVIVACELLVALELARDS